MEENWLTLMANETQMKQIAATNAYTERFGLSLGEEDVKLLVAERQNVLKSERRVEFGESILPKIIFAFCDSVYITQDNYVDTLVRLQEIFFLFKNEMEDEITDEELLSFMSEQFEHVCYGDLNYLEGTCLELFAQAIRAGYRGYHRTDGKDEFAQFDVVARWDRELYLKALEELTGE